MECGQWDRHQEAGTNCHVSMKNGSAEWCEWTVIFLAAFPCSFSYVSYVHWHVQWRNHSSNSFLHAKTMQVVTTFLDKTSLAGAVSFPILLSLSKFLGIISESFWVILLIFSSLFFANKIYPILFFSMIGYILFRW